MKLYEIVGLAVLPFVIGGCPDKDPSESVPIEQRYSKEDLESILRTSLNSIKERFAQGEIEQSEYYKLIESLLEDRGIDLSSGETGYMASIFNSKLDAKWHFGFDNDYYARKDTPWSSEAKADIAKIENFTSQVRTYLKKQIGNHPVSEKRLSAEIHNYVFSHVKEFETASSIMDRRNGITGYLTSIFKREFKIVEGEEPFSSGYSRKDIEKAMDKIKVD